jgi:hypothetical protein
VSFLARCLWLRTMIRTGRDRRKVVSRRTPLQVIDDAGAFEPRASEPRNPTQSDLSDGVIHPRDASIGQHASAPHDDRF